MAWHGMALNHPPMTFSRMQHRFPDFGSRMKFMLECNMKADDYSTVG